MGRVRFGRFVILWPEPNPTRYKFFFFVTQPNPPSLKNRPNSTGWVGFGKSMGFLHTLIIWVARPGPHGLGRGEGTSICQKRRWICLGRTRWWCGLPRFFGFWSDDSLVFGLMRRWMVCSVRRVNMWGGYKSSF